MQLTRKRACKWRRSGQPQICNNYLQLSGTRVSILGQFQRLSAVRNGGYGAIYFPAFERVANKSAFGSFIRASKVAG